MNFGWRAEGRSPICEGSERQESRLDGQQLGRAIATVMGAAAAIKIGPVMRAVSPVGFRSTPPGSRSFRFYPTARASIRRFLGAEVIHVRSIVARRI